MEITEEFRFTFGEAAIRSARDSRFASYHLAHNGFKTLTVIERQDSNSRDSPNRWSVGGGLFDDK